jgi:hypothetical protein
MPAPVPFLDHRLAQALQLAEKRTVSAFDTLLHLAPLVDSLYGASIVAL